MKTIRTFVIAALAFCALAVTAQTASAQVAVRVGPVEIIAGRPVYYAPVDPYPFGICGYDEYGYAIPCAPPAAYAGYPYWEPGYWDSGIWFPGCYRGFGYHTWRYDHRYVHPGYFGRPVPYRGGYGGGYRGGEGYRWGNGGHRGGFGGYGHHGRR